MTDRYRDRLEQTYRRLVVRYAAAGRLDPADALALAFVRDELGIGPGEYSADVAAVGVGLLFGLTPRD